MKKIILSILFVFCLYGSELYKEIKINYSDLNNLNALSDLGLDVDHSYKTDTFIQFAINEYDLAKIISNNIPYIVIHEDLESFYANRLDQNYFERDFELGSMGGYYTFEEIEENLDELSNLYPNIITQKISIGTTLEGRNIWAVKISDNPNVEENEPEALYTGLHHAREPMSYMNLFYFMHWLGENYNSDDIATHIVNNRQLWFVPAVNPDGLVYNESIAPGGGGMQRKNARETCNGTPDGIDLNRNYSYMWGYDNDGSSGDGCNETYRGTSPFSEPETSVIRDFVEEHDFSIAFNYHSYGNLLIYPFGYEEENQAPQEDLDIFVEFGEDMTQFNNYALGSGPDLLYTVNGEACDWMYGVHDVFAYTPEIGNNGDGFWPATNRIVPLAEENLYPNQLLALYAGARYDLDIIVENTEFDIGESYPLYISIINRGLGESNGNLVVNIISSENIVFELDYIELEGLDGRQELNLGDITYFEVNPLFSGVSMEEIVVQIFDEDEYIYEKNIEFILGNAEVFVDEDFENDNFWTVGDSDDDASAGIWERVVPVGTYDLGQIIQPNEDHTIDGSFCFLTANPVDDDELAWANDVDGGKTTLLSPLYDLSEYDGAIVSYWKWYTNNLGNNPDTDHWRVDVTFDDGDNWFNLEYTTDSNLSWEKQQFLLTDYVDYLTSEIRFKFIAEDIFYEGDNGTGGSLVEAAIDDFLIEVYNEGNDILIGDINFDGNIDVLDVVSLVNYILDQTDFTDLQLIAADMNGDSDINIQDIVILVGDILD
tara:strand:+ start:1826 stop:4138 length:2313 start_codon:yes stop_codon:yes gene_type:complete